MLLKARFTQSPARRGGWIIANNGELTLTYSEALRRGFTRPRFRRAIIELVEKGLIDITRLGVPKEKLPNFYALSDRWREYGKPEFRAVMIQKKETPGFDKIMREKKRSLASEAAEKPKQYPPELPRPVIAPPSVKRPGEWMLFSEALERIPSKADRERLSRLFLHDKLEEAGIETNYKVDNGVMVNLDTLQAVL